MPVSEITLWAAIGVAFVVGFVLGKAHEFYLHRHHRRRWRRIEQENAMPLAHNRPEIDDIFNQEASWENPWDRVVSDHGMRPIE